MQRNRGYEKEPNKIIKQKNKCHIFLNVLDGLNIRVIRVERIINARIDEWNLNNLNDRKKENTNNK